MVGYDRTDAGPLVILVSGATQYRRVDRVTPRLADDLAAAGFTVITYDRRARGESGDTLPYAVHREIEDIEALIDAAEGRGGLFGMSSGAVLALEAAAALGNKVTGAFLYDPPLDPQQDAAEPWRQHAEMAALAREDRGEEMMVRFMRGVGLSPEALEGVRRSPAWPNFVAVGKTLEHDYRILAEARDADQPPQRWRSVTAPVMVAAGDKSLPFMVAGADWVAGGVPGARRLMVAGQGHDYDPEVLAPLVADFFGST